MMILYRIVLPIISVHGLRHSNASLMINNGIDVKAVSEHLGHCNIAVTGDIYSHIILKLQGDHKDNNTTPPVESTSNANAQEFPQRCATIAYTTIYTILHDTNGIKQ